MELEGKQRVSQQKAKNMKILSSFENQEKHYIITVKTSSHI